jgi:hypothetical protein
MDVVAGAALGLEGALNAVRDAEVSLRSLAVDVGDLSRGVPTVMQAATVLRADARRQNEDRNGEW